MATKEPSDGSGWLVKCTCGVVVAVGDGQPPTQGAAEELGTKHGHVTEAGGGVHRLQVLTRGRITEKS